MARVVARWRVVIAFVMAGALVALWASTAEPGEGGLKGWLFGKVGE